MPTVQKTVTITVDNTTYEVANMSADIQQLVVYLDEWRQEEADQTSALLKTRAALNDIQNTMLTTIQNERAAQAEPAPEVVDVVETKAKTRTKKAAK